MKDGAFREGGVNNGICRQAHIVDHPGTQVSASGDLPEEALMGPMAELGAESWVHSAALPRSIRLGVQETKQPTEGRVYPRAVCPIQ